MAPQGQKRARLDEGDEGTEAEVDNGGAAAFSKAVVQNLVCPITHQLFVDPCIAEDGRLYEKAAIFKWVKFEQQKRSPVTNEPMRASSATLKRGTRAWPSFKVAPRAQGNAPHEVTDDAGAHRVCN